MASLTQDSQKALIEITARTMDALVTWDRKMLRPIFAKSRVRPTDIHRAMKEYGGKFSPAPLNSYENIDIIPIGKSVAEFAVDAYFYDNNGNQTDLSAELTIDLEGDPIVSIDGVHVL